MKPIRKPNKRDILAFRHGILNGRKSTDMCFVVGTALEGYLTYLEFECRLIEGEVSGRHHWWLKLPDKSIIDATADQFRKPDGKKMPAVYIGQRPKWYRSIPVDTPKVSGA